MINVGVITSTRAEYGLLKPVYLELQNNKNVNVHLIVTGTHLSKKYGYTIKDIINDNIKISNKISIIDDSKNETPSSIISKSIILFDKYFKKNKFDAIVLLGDRYETLGFAIACMFNNIPICHMHGGETTEGAIDEAIRHSITKMSYLHFTSCEEYRNRVIQLGENPKRVYNVGSTGIENIINLDLINKNDLSKNLKFDLNRYFVVTFHPVTLKNDKKQLEFKNLLDVLSEYDDYQVIFTKSNADDGSLVINKMIDKYVLKHKNSKAYFSLGTKRYLSLVKYSCAVIGNSSSGVIEVPALLVPTVNIGDRQKGRVSVKSIIDCKTNKNSIDKAIKIALAFDGKLTLNDIPFYKKNTSKNIANIIVKTFGKPIDLMKKFNDIKVK